MGWAEKMAGEAVKASREAPVTPQPSGPALGAAPSEFLETVARGMLVDCMRGAADIQRVLSPPAIVGPSGQAGPQANPMAVLLASQLRVLHAQAALLDLLLTFLSGRPELRPAGQPGNGTTPKPDGS